jgi:integrase
MAIERRKDNKKRVLKEGEYQRANGSFEFRWRDSTGKRHYLYSPTLEQLREKEREFLKDITDGIKPEAKQMTVNDLFDRWVQLKRGLKTNTFSNYIYMYEQFVRNDLGRVKLDKIKKSDVRAFYNMLADERTLKVSTIDSIHTVLHQVLELGVEDEYLRFNPSDNALKELKKAHNKDIEKRKALTRAEQLTFENFLADSRQYNHWKYIFTVMLYTGMRVGEITGLRWCDVDFENNAISVNHTLVYYATETDSGKREAKFQINTTKTAAGMRTIPMLPIVKQAFLDEKELQKEFGMQCNSVIDGYTDFIFINRFGNVQHQGTLNKAIRRIIRDCNYEQLDKKEKGDKKAVTLPPFSCHILRHTFTTRMCEAGVNIKVMQDILGHSDAQTTMNIYADATKDFKQSEMSSLDNYFSEWKN